MRNQLTLMVILALMTTHAWAADDCPSGQINLGYEGWARCAEGYQLRLSKAGVFPGQTLVVDWKAPADHSTQDQIGIFAKQSARAITAKPVAAGPVGMVLLRVPTQPGQYDVKYVREGGAVETMKSFTVLGASN